MSVMSDAIKLCLYDPCKSTRKKQDFITSLFHRSLSLYIGMAIALALGLWPWPWPWVFWPC